MNQLQLCVAVSFFVGMVLFHLAFQNHYRVVSRPTLTPNWRKSVMYRQEHRQRQGEKRKKQIVEEREEKEEEEEEEEEEDGKVSFKVVFQKSDALGSPKLVVLWSTWRSGTTFLGKLLSEATNATFYSYEPLHIYKVKIMDKDNAKTRSAMMMLKDILRCQYYRHQDQVLYMAEKKWYYEYNSFLESQCMPARACRAASFVSSVCRGSSLHVAKVLRLSLRWLRPLLEDDDLDFQVIYLVRDPRAVISSRTRVSWCLSPTCRDPRTVCSLLERDLQEAATLLREYPDRFKFILYDEICQNMSAALTDMMDFLGMPVTAAQRKMLQYKSSSSKKYTINKNPILQTNLWRNMSSYQDVVVPVQKHCRASLESLGLRVFETKQDFQDPDISSLARANVP